MIVDPSVLQPKINQWLPGCPWMANHGPVKGPRCPNGEGPESRGLEHEALRFGDREVKTKGFFK